jgi:MFS family permease
MSNLKELLRIRDFRYLWTAQVASDFGDSLTNISLLFLIQELTGSTVDIALLLISVALPSLILGVVSGVYVDRFDRRRTMIVSDFVRALLVLGFIFVQSEALLPLIYGIAFVQAAIGTLFNPARSALMPRIVGEERLLAANSVSQTTRVILSVLGTTAAGILASVTDNFAPAFIVDSMTFLLSGWLIIRIRTSGEAEQPAAPSKVWTEMKLGFRVMIVSRPLQGVLVAAGVAMLGLGSVNVLAVPFMIGELQISEALFGLIEFAQVSAMVLSGGIVAVFATRLRASVLVSVGLIGVGAAVALVSTTNTVWQVLAPLFLVGLFIAPTQAGVSTLSQTLIEDRMRGRVGGAIGAVISGANVASMALAGVLAAAIGIRNVFVVAGVVCAAAGVVAWFMLRGLGRGRTERVSPATDPEPSGHPETSL